MLTTHKIKAILTMMGHTGIKRTAKRSNAALTYREFISNTASIVVRSTVDDISITEIVITPLTSTLKTLPALQPVSFAEFTTELTRNNSLNLQAHLADYKNIYNIPVVTQTLETSVNYLIVNHNYPPFVLNMSDRELIKLSDFTVAKQNYSVATVDYDGTVDGTFVVPCGYYIYNYYPDYQQLIALSPDMTQGACTYNPESDVYTFDTNIAKNLNIELIDKSNHEISFLKTARKYDIIATCN